MIESRSPSRPTGLSEALALERLHTEGRNVLPAAARRSLGRMAVSVLTEPMILLLVLCGSIYAGLGDRSGAALLFTFVVFVIAVTLYQEHKTERALEALRDLSSPRALVLRDGKERRIAGADVVRGDLVLLSEGDRVPADAWLIEAINLSLDESLLTGESAPVRKRAVEQGPAGGAVPRPGGDDLPVVFSGTLVVAGRGTAEVHATGGRTEVGRIGQALARFTNEDTALQREVHRLVRNLALASVGLCVLVAVIYGIRQGGLHHGGWLRGALAGLSLAMSILPEEIPMILTVFFALGAWRISRCGVLTRRMHAIEALGAATVLCVDKTGTLTENRMTVTKLCAGGVSVDVTGAPLPEGVHQVVEYSILASQSDPHDPMEVAFARLGQQRLAGTEHLHHGLTLWHEYPLSPARLAMCQVWRTGDRPGGPGALVACKGAPEAVAELCRLDRAAQAALRGEVEALACDGLRVLAVARAEFTGAELPDDPHGFAWRLLGLVGLMDPVRQGVPEAIRQCYRAGLRVVMITGDHALTGRSVAQRIGLAPRDEILTGPDMAALGEAELRERVGRANLFVRVMPEQKLRLVELLKEAGAVVAMTGDGVNDAPALRAADIGVAMGGRGTDVAREAAALVLVRDDFAALVGAVRLGRRIFDNLQKALAYTIAIHVPIAGLALVPVVVGWPLLLLPAHIAVLEMIIDPACSVVFEAESEEGSIMDRPPRDLRAPLLSRRTVVLSVLQGLGVLLTVLCIYGLALWRGLGEQGARSLGFGALVVANLGLILINRSWSETVFQTLRRPNRALWGVFGGALVLGVLVMALPALQRLFKFAPVPLWALLPALLVGGLSVGWFQVWIAVRRKGTARS